MLAFFRINDPYRIIVIFIIMLAIRIPSFISSDILTVPELQQMLIGEKMTQGALLYSEIWETVGPLSALFYAVIDFLFGRSHLAYQIIAYFLVCFQVFIFNYFLLKSRAYTENTYIPGLIYGLLISISYDMHTLSPTLLGMTFILLALNNLISHIEVRAKRDELILNIGIYLGLAVLIYLPFAIFGFATLVVFILFTGTIGRRYFLMVFGFLLPVVIVIGYLMVTERFYDFSYSYFYSYFKWPTKWFIEVKSVLILLVVPISFFLLALFKIMQGARLTNYQFRLTQAMFVWMIFCVIYIILADYHAPSLYLVLMPSVAFYIAHYYLAKKRNFLTGLSFLLFVSLVITTSLFSNYNAPLAKYYNDEAYLVGGNPSAILINKKVLVLDDDIRPYYQAIPATPFLNWNLSKEVFTELDYYDNLTIIYNGIYNDPPQIIIDPNDLMRHVFEKIPSLARDYARKEGDKYFLTAINN